MSLSSYIYRHVATTRPSAIIYNRYEHSWETAIQG